ncbi:MAG TPA: caspase family protein, partial [Gemmataceae bacterium]
KTPAFYRAQQFHERFHRQDVIEVLLRERDVAETLTKAARVSLEPPNFGVFDSVRVRIKPRDQRVKDKNLEVVLDIESRIQHADYVPVRAELWVNDRRLHDWQLDGQTWHRECIIKREQLRAGENDLTLQCYNKVEGRGEGWLEASARVVCDRLPKLPKLHGLAVGLNDYSRSARENGEPLLRDLLTPRADAKAMRDAWLAQKDLLYSDVQIDLLPEGEEPVGRETILKYLDRLAARAGPDDRVFLFLAGHGETLPQGNRKQFVFCCPDFDQKRLDKTSISARELYQALAKIPGQKVVFLDACRSGHVAGQPARDLTPGGLGPIILAACDRGESSYEIQGAPHAVFATAILEAMGERFARADQNGDSRLDARELYDYAARRVPELLQKAGVVQTPARSPAQLARYPLLAGKLPAEK